MRYKENANMQQHVDMNTNEHSMYKIKRSSKCAKIIFGVCPSKIMNYLGLNYIYLQSHDVINDSSGVPWRSGTDLSPLRHFWLA